VESNSEMNSYGRRAVPECQTCPIPFGDCNHHADAQDPNFPLSALAVQSSEASLGVWSQLPQLGLMQVAILVDDTGQCPKAGLFYANGLPVSPVTVTKVN